MRIALITMHSCPLARLGERDTGGMNVYALALASQLTEAGYCVDIFTRRHTSKEPEVIEVSERVRVVHIPAGPAREHKEALYDYLPEFIHGARRFKETQGTDYALIHSHYWLSGYAGTILQREWGVPHLTSFHTLAEVKNRAVLGNEESPHRAPVERQVAAQATRIVAFTHHEKEALVRLYGASPERIAVIPPGVDFSLFRSQDGDEARRRLGLSPEAKVLLFVGRLEPLKGADLLLEATALLEREDVRVLIVGGDQRTGERRGLRALAKKLRLGERVSFPGSVPHEELPWYYSAADIVSMPSSYESFGLVAAEALACGAPVVATKVGGLPSVVRDGMAGYLISTRCAEAFAERIELLLGNDLLRRSMAVAAPQTVAHLDWPLIAEQVIDLYSETLGTDRAPVACAGS